MLLPAVDDAIEISDPWALIAGEATVSSVASSTAQSETSRWGHTGATQTVTLPAEAGRSINCRKSNMNASGVYGMASGRRVRARGCGYTEPGCRNSTKNPAPYTTQRWRPGDHHGQLRPASELGTRAKIGGQGQTPERPFAALKPGVL